MAWMALAGMIGSLAGQAAAGQQQSAATKEGAQSQAEIEGMNRAYQQREFDKIIADNVPFREAGNQAIPLWKDAASNKLNVQGMPLYELQKQLIEQGNEGNEAPAYIGERSLAGLRGVEGEAQKGRLIDLVKVGLGASGSAGQANLGLGNVLGQSYMNQGDSAAAGLMNAANIRQSLINKGLEEASGYPAYQASQRKNRLSSFGDAYSTWRNPPLS